MPLRTFIVDRLLAPNPFSFKVLPHLVGKSIEFGPELAFHDTHVLLVEARMVLLNDILHGTSIILVVLPGIVADVWQR